MNNNYKVSLSTVDEINTTSKSYEGKEDFISNLPDGVVGHVLSLLPIKDAVRTSVLSRDWEYLWTSMCDIEIEDEHKSLCGDDKVACFINFVTRILMRTCNSRIKTFSLSCDQIYHINYLETWISWVLMRNVENLKIVARKIHRFDSRWCFSGWTLLTELELYLSCTLVLPVNIWFPNLKRMTLVSSSLHESIKLKTERIPVQGRIILKFPVLQALVLRRCEWLDVSFVEIHAPELISFRTSCLVEVKNYEIKIYGAKLAMFESMEGSIDNFDLHTPEISGANLFHYLFIHEEHQVRKTLLTRTHNILKQLQHVRRLKLSGEIVEALVPSSERGLIFSTFDCWKHGLVFPTFDRLKELYLGACVLKNTLMVLRTLPLLEVLSLSAFSWADKDRAEPWPTEILSNLKKVEIIDFWFRGFDFSIFILENASYLNEMFVFIGTRPGSTLTVDATTSRLSKVKPKSSTCRLFVFKQTKEMLKFH